MYKKHEIDVAGFDENEEFTGCWDGSAIDGDYTDLYSTDPEKSDI